MGRPKKTHEQYVEEVNSLGNNEYEVLEKYTRSCNPTKMRHKKCGKTFNMRPNQFISQGSRCPVCSMKEAGIKRAKSSKQFKKEIYDLVGKEYTVLGKYVRTRDKVLAKHNDCERNFYMSPGDFVRGARCPHCFGTFRKTTTEFKKDVYDLVGDEFTVLGEYLNNKADITMRHNKCGRIYTTKPNCFLNGNRCAECYESSGEEAVASYLDEKEIHYEREYTFEDCFNINVLRFDFALFKEKELITLIEYQGQQHYAPVKLFGGEEAFGKQIKRDKIKRDYCKDNNIPLIEIPYTEKDIGRYLSKRLTELKQASTV